MMHSLSAITLATRDMRRAVAFYRFLGFNLAFGGEEADFSSFRVGTSHLNIISDRRPVAWWGRVIFYDSDVDGLYARVVAAGYKPEAPPRDAPWGERFFHLTDPDGHELSFAWPSR